MNQIQLRQKWQQNMPLSILNLTLDLCLNVLGRVQYKNVPEEKGRSNLDLYIRFDFIVV